METGFNRWHIEKQPVQPKVYPNKIFIKSESRFTGKSVYRWTLIKHNILFRHTILLNPNQPDIHIQGGSRLSG